MDQATFERLPLAVREAYYRAAGYVYVPPNNYAPDYQKRAYNAAMALVSRQRMPQFEIADRVRVKSDRGMHRLVDTIFAECHFSSEPFAICSHVRCSATLKRHWSVRWSWPPVARTHRSRAWA